MSRRETTSGGVGGFFAKREIEVEVRPGENAHTPEVAAAFAAQLAEAQERQQKAGGADLLGAHSGGVRPATAPEIDALPGSTNVTVDDLFPPAPPAQAQNLAALFNAGLPPVEPIAAEPPATPPAEPVARCEVLDDDEWEEEYGELEDDEEEVVVAEIPQPEQPTGAFDYLGTATEPSAAEDDHAPTAAGPVPSPGVPVAPEPVADAAPPVLPPFAPAPEPIGEATAPEPVVAPEPEPVVEPEPVTEPEPASWFEGPAPADAPPAPDLVVAATTPAPAPVTGLPAAALVAAERLVARGLRSGLADAIAEEAIAGLAPLLPEADPKTLVTDALARRIPVHALRAGPGVVGFVGPGGAGKTRCVARLAAAHARHGVLPVSVIALRSPDGGAELRRLLAPYGVSLHAVESGAEGAARIAGLRGEGLVIVDTPGVSPRSTGELRALGFELDALAPDELHLAVPATIGPAAAQELVGGVRELGVGALVLTHTDETEMLGTVIGLAIDSGLPLSYLARGQAVEAGLRPASATELAHDLVP